MPRCLEAGRRTATTLTPRTLIVLQSTKSCRKLPCRRMAMMKTMQSAPGIRLRGLLNREYRAELLRSHFTYPYHHPSVFIPPSFVPANRHGRIDGRREIFRCLVHSKRLFPCNIAQGYGMFPCSYQPTRGLQGHSYLHSHRPSRPEPLVFWEASQLAATDCGIIVANNVPAAVSISVLSDCFSLPHLLSISPESLYG